MSVSSVVKISVAGVIGAIICAAGAALYVIFPNIVKTKISQTLPIVNGTDLYKAWETTPIPIYMQYYIFNVTNADDILTNNSKPILQQLGPYTYREGRKKENVTFDYFDDVVTYEQRKWFIFEPHLTKGSLDDEVTFLNVPLYALTVKTEGILTGFKNFITNQAIRNYRAKVFIKKTVDELLFRGYQDDLMMFLAQQAKREILPNGTFGLMYGQNDTTDGVYSAYTGVLNFARFPGIATWNGSRSVDYWNDTYCNMINGTDGSTFTPFLTRDKVLRLFSTDLCRSVYMTYDEDGDVHGIKTFRYATPFQLLADNSINPDNECFCTYAEDCPLSGLLNVSNCKKGAPLLLSPVHFYQSDPSLVKTVEGLNPNKAEHDTIIDVEPTTGVVVRAARRIQVNVPLRPYDHIKVMKELPRVVLPLFWVNESVDLGSERAELFKAKIYKPVLIGKALTYALLGVGCFIMVVTIVFAVRYCSQKQKLKMVSEKKLPMQLNDKQNNIYGKNNEANESLLKPTAF